MNKFYHFNTSSLENEIEDRSFISFTKGAELESFHFVKYIQTERTVALDSSTLPSDVCSSMRSVGPLPDKPLKLQETEIISDIWDGCIIGYEEESVILDVHNSREPQKRLKLRVNKNIIEGDIARMNVGTDVRVSYKKIRTYEDKIKTIGSVRLRESAKLPDDILKREFEAKMKRLSYMIVEEE